MGRWEMGRWGGGEMGRWGNRRGGGEAGRQGGGEIGTGKWGMGGERVIIVTNKHRNPREK